VTAASVDRLVENYQAATASGTATALVVREGR
jgi:hypothetical protein